MPIQKTIYTSGKFMWHSYQKKHRRFDEIISINRPTARAKSKEQMRILFFFVQQDKVRFNFLQNHRVAVPERSLMLMSLKWRMNTWASPLRALRRGTAHRPVSPFTADLQEGMISMTAVGFCLCLMWGRRWVAYLTATTVRDKSVRI